LAAELIIGVALLSPPSLAPPDPATATAGVASPPSSLVVDGRTVQLIGLGPATAPLLGRIRGEIGGAVNAVAGFWGEDWQRDVVIVAAATDDEFAAEAGPGLRWTGVAAVAVADRVDFNRRIAFGQRIVFAPGAASMSDAALRIVLRHELFHYAARTDTAFDAPLFMTEGVADFVGRPHTPVPGPNALPATLPSNAELITAGPQRPRAYDRAWWFARFIADSYGAPTLRRLYLRACGPGHPDPAAAVSETLGIGLPQLLDRWARWLAR
jgi:hypothetical protein